MLEGRFGKAESWGAANLERVSQSMVNVMGR